MFSLDLQIKLQNIFKSLNKYSILLNKSIIHVVLLNSYKKEAFFEGFHNLHTGKSEESLSQQYIKSRQILSNKNCLSFPLRLLRQQPTYEHIIQPFQRLESLNNISSILENIIITHVLIVDLGFKLKFEWLKRYYNIPSYILRLSLKSERKSFTKVVVSANFSETILIITSKSNYKYKVNLIQIINLISFMQQTQSHKMLQDHQQIINKLIFEHSLNLYNNNINNYSINLQNNQCKSSNFLLSKQMHQDQAEDLLLIDYFYFRYYQIRFDCQYFIKTNLQQILSNQTMQHIDLTIDQNCVFKNVLKELREIRLALKECGYSNKKIQSIIQTSISDFNNQNNQENFTQLFINRLKVQSNRQHFLNRMLVDLHLLKISLTEQKTINSDQTKTQKGDVKKKKKEKKSKKQSTTAIVSNTQIDQQNIFRIPAKMIITDKNSQFQSLQMQKAELRQNLMKIHMFKQFLEKELIMQMMGEKMQRNLTLTEMWGFPSIQNHCR